MSEKWTPPPNSHENAIKPCSTVADRVNDSISSHLAKMELRTFRGVIQMNWWNMFTNMYVDHCFLIWQFHCRLCKLFLQYDTMFLRRHLLTISAMQVELEEPRNICFFENSTAWIWNFNNFCAWRQRSRTFETFTNCWWKNSVCPFSPKVKKWLKGGFW